MMAVRKTARPSPPNGFVASAARLPEKGLTRYHGSEQWMEEGWRYYDTVGELRYVANWVGNVMSRAVLKAAVNDGGAMRVAEEGPVAEAMEAYFGSLEGQAAMLQATGINLTVAGEGYHIMTEDEEWHTLSSGRVTQQQGTLYADFGDGRRPLTKKELCIRVWVPHPRDPIAADSPVRSNLSTLREITRLNQHISAQLDSRLAGSGILFIPSEIQFAAPEGVDPQANQADAFMQVLGETMLSAIQGGQRGTAAEVVPLVVTAPGEALDKVQHLTFWSPLDAAVLQMRDSAVKHLALGLDTPPEVLMGVADANHWNAWLVDEAAVKSHLEPRLQVVSAAVTTKYLRPAIQGIVPNPEDWHVVADTSAIRLRPDLSTQAIDLYDRGELSGDALRRETGFEPEDTPDQTEFVLWLLRKTATGQTTPEATMEALRRLGADLGLAGEGETVGINDATRTDTEPQTTPREPRIGRAIRRQERVAEGRESAALLAACNALVYRALERAGNKMCDAKAKANGLGEYPAHERYMHRTGTSGPSSVTCLQGAWDTATPVLGAFTEETSDVISVLDSYTATLIGTKAEHSVDRLRRALRAAELMA